MPTVKKTPHTKAALLARIHQLEEANRQLKAASISTSTGKTVSVPDALLPLFEKAQKTVGEYFSHLKFDPGHGTIEVNDQRYVLVRASALSYDFLRSIQQLYSDRGEQEAFRIGKDFLFDISHVIGVSDAANFHQKMNLTDPIARLSAGPVHFAYSGWAYVEILPESSPSPDEHFFMLYHHPFSFEADSWMKAGKKSASPVCIMNSGYSSGWCEESFGIPLTAVEISCKACGDESCTFIMAPPDQINRHLEKYRHKKNFNKSAKREFDIPTFFERKKVEEEMERSRLKAEESDRAKSDFLANMSHEIRTPLNTIIGYADLMLRDKPPREFRGYLETVKKSGDLLQRLIADILDLSKIEAGQLVLEQVTYSIKELFSFTESTAQSLLLPLKKNVAVSSHYDPRLNDLICTDPLRLQQIMYNLLSNAIKFTEQGSITYGAKLKNKTTIEFYIKDTGIGISREKSDKVFEKFGQADASTTRKYGGSGLGLTISRKLSELMGGSLSMDSIPGKGSVFSFLIPYHPVQIKKKRISEKISRSKQSGKKTILLVEDHLVNQRLTRIILEKSGYKVICASNGEEAVAMYKKHPEICMVIMDVQMPVLDGLEATRQIRAYEQQKQLKRRPVIALTAHAMKGDLEKCMEAGCDSYVSKPFMIETLLKTMKTEEERV